MTVTIARADHIAAVTFARPPANHVSVELLRELADALDLIDSDPMRVG